DLMEAVHGKLADKRQALQNALVAGERAKWAEKKAAGTVGNKPVKVIRLTGDEFGAGLAGKSLRDAAVSYAKKHFVDAAFENASTGQSIEVTWQSVKHALANANDAEMRVFHALPRILKTARYVESVPDKLGRPDIQAVHRYAVKVLLKDEPLTIGVIVRETKDGHRFYDHFIIKSKNPAGISEAAPPAGVLGDQPTAGLAGNSVDPQTSDDKGDKSHKGNDDGPDSASQTSAIRGTGAQTRGEDSARQPDHWDAVAGQYSAGAVAALRKRAADNAWSPEFVAALSETLGTLPPELCAFFDYRVDIGSDVAIVHRVNLDNVPEHMRASYAQAGAMTVNGMRIEFIQDRQPTTNTLRHELVHLAWQELYGTDRRDGMARKVVDQVLERIAGDGERMLKWATSRSEKDVFQQLEANQIKKMLRRIKKYGKEGKHLPSTLKGMLELDLMIGSGYMDAAKGAGLSITPEGQYSAVALYMAMAKRHGVTLDREFAQEEGVAYLCGEDEAAARQVFGAMAEGMEREVVRRNMPTLASVAPEQSSWHYKIAKLQRGLNFISDPEGSKAKQQEIDEITRGPLHEGFRAYNEVMRDYASQHPGWFNFDDHGNAWLRESKMIEKSMRHTPMLLFFPNPAHAALVKAYIHGHYRINQKTGAKVWVDSYTDKRQTKAGQMEFAHW
ncbi:MAG: hypothetical protein JZU52_05780, partial [Lamprocystis purpurea]|nr:hypothetical protein [Lamprocystis purpurea]